MFVLRHGSPDSGHGKGSSDDARAVAGKISDAVERLANLWVLAAQEADLQLSQRQLRALRALETAPDGNLTALAERLEIGLPTASRLCDRLEAAGLLERGSHPRTRREVRLTLTLRGQSMLKDVADRRARALAVALEGMDAADRGALSRSLRAFLAAQDKGP